MKNLTVKQLQATRDKLMSQVHELEDRIDVLDKEIEVQSHKESLSKFKVGTYWRSRYDIIQIKSFDVRGGALCTMVRRDESCLLINYRIDLTYSYHQYQESTKEEFQKAISLITNQV